MTDIVDIARKRRALLAAEVARLDRFLRMAAALQKYEHGGYGEATRTAAAADPTPEPAAPGQPESLVIKGMAAKVLKAKGLAESSAIAEPPVIAGGPAAAGNPDTGGTTEHSPKATAADTPALAKRKAGGGFLDKALHFIGEEVRGQTVSVVPATETAARPAASPAAPAPTAVAPSVPGRPSAPMPTDAVATGEITGEITPDHFHFADSAADESRADGSKTHVAAERPADAPAAPKPAPDAKVQDAPAVSPAAASQGVPSGPRLKAGRAGSVDIHVGQKLRQRRWMIGMSRQQLGDAVGVGLDLIRNYEMGTERIAPDRLWQVAAALDVPMSYFFEEIEGQSTNDAVTAAVLSEAEARMALHDDTAVPADEASGDVSGQVAEPKRAAS